MAATSNRLAVEAALWALGEGGSAVDAAVAADAVLGVVQPHSSGIGGDAFALVAEPGERRRRLQRLGRRRPRR